ncbi:MAG: adenylate/guanylate cyclase domain-containing protein [Chloroflexi bacterium]|nr:MAG: adenylate/guanylate cyclase domain-containing protein [Chloroflexota bacterium]
MAGLPQGTLTFLLTDLVGSTRTWEADTRAMRQAMVQHDEIVYGAVQRHTGAMVESGREGDSILAVFVGSREAAACALDVQRAFHAATWPGGLELKVRIALHTGEVELRGGHYFGPPLNRCARVLALCHGGQTLVTQATSELLAEDPPQDVELTDLGVHKLKDLKRAEHIYQLTDLTRPERFAPLDTRRDYKSNLPLLLTSFVGRERELAELRDLLARSRLLTLTGTGGAGKTRLAKQLALNVVDDMRDGVWLVDVSPVSDPRLVARAVATALDVEEQQGRSLTETLAEYCRDRAMVLVLDNCEHLLGACAELAEGLLGSCPQLRLVATSREPLNVGGEVTWTVPSLAESEATRLFVDRARSRSPRFELTDQNAHVVMQICRRLDGIPLAIELAAARTAMMPPNQLLRRLDEGFAVLASGTRTAAKRQQTLEATLDWSHGLLSDQERTLLRRLAVFVSHFSLDASEAVCWSSDLPRESILTHLGQLVAKSLVQTVDDRYGCLDTIRSYARQKLADAGEFDTFHRTHARYCLEIVGSRRPGALADWLDQVELEHDNVRGALTWCVSHDPEAAASLVAGLYEFWLLRGHALEARGFLGRLSSQLPAASPRRPRVLLDAGVFAYTAGDFASAPALIREGLASARETNDLDLMARGLVFQGGVALAAGDIGPAQAALDQALAIARDTEHGRQEAEALHHLGSLASVRGDTALARMRFTESLELRRRLGIDDESLTTLTLRATATLTSDPASAHSDIAEALELGLALKDRRVAWSLDVLSCLTALDGDAERALQLAGAASAMFEATAQRPAALWRRFTEPLMDRARQELGGEAAAKAWQSGRALTFEQALHYALEPERVAHR